MNLTWRLVLILAASSSVAYAGERTFDRHIDAPGGGHLTVNLDIGSVSVAGSSAHQVTVHATAEGDDADLHGLSIQVEPDSGGVHVREQYSRGSSWGWFWHSSPRVHFTIEVPRDYPVEVTTNGGFLELANVHASVRGNTNGGSIKVRDIQGEVNVHTMGGGISAEHLQGPARLVTMGGAIEARDVRGDLEARTMGGGITLTDVDGTVTAHTSGGSVSAGELGDHDVSLDTNGGSIHLRMPATAHASVDARTFGGGVSSSIPFVIESSSRSHLRGSINGAGHTIRLHTNGGGISIEPLS